MALSVTHQFVSAIADGADATLVRPSNWNATHTLTGTASVAQGGTGLSTIAALSTWVADSLDTPFVITPGAGNSIRVNAGGTAWEAYTPSAGGATLNGITAATGAVTIASGNNTGIVWNWANTTNTTVAFTLGETTAATNGTSFNQVLVHITTLAASTQVPFMVSARGTKVMWVPAAGEQVVFPGGSVGTPGIVLGGTAGANTPGLSTGSQRVQACYGGGSAFQWYFNSGKGYLLLAQDRGLDFANPQLSADTGYGGPYGYGLTASNVVIGIATASVENLRWVAGTQQVSYGSADAVSYALSFRKSRGTVASPTVITTADDLATISAYGYVGATNTYREATRIRSDSIGTVSDATTGVGGEIVLGTMKQGVDTAAVDRFKVDQFGHLVSLIGTANTPTISAGGGTSPAILGTDSAFVVTIGTGGTATSVTVTFGTAYVTNPPCVQVESDTDLVAFKVVPAVGSVTIDSTLAFTAGSKLYCTVTGML